MTTFFLPDLGEGLPEAEIVQWHVEEGQMLQADQPMLSVETAKAIVDIPAPETGIVSAIYAKAGEVVATGAPLMAFSAATTNQQPTPHAAAPETPARQEVAVDQTAIDKGTVDQGTVVGKIPEDAENLEHYFQEAAVTASSEQPLSAMPAARALATALGLSLSTIKGTGPKGIIQLSDVQQHINQRADQKAVSTQGNVNAIKQTAALPALSDHEGAQRTHTLKGARRAMAHAMAKAHSEVVKVTITEDAHIHRWREREDTTLRMIRAISYAAGVEPALNAWYDHDTLSVTQFDDVHLGMAVDTPDGLFVPVLDGVDSKKPKTLRRMLDELREQLKTRSVPKERLTGATITLSNFGTIAGRYASPVVSPPQVAIVGAGRSREAAVAHKGKMKIRRILPLSLSFDHRALTGGEAARFLRALIEDLEAKD